jgi:surface protein
MFYGCNNLKEIKGLEEWDTSNVTNISNMFEGCGRFLKESMDLFKKKWEKNHKKH